VSESCECIFSELCDSPQSCTRALASVSISPSSSLSYSLLNKAVATFQDFHMVTVVLWRAQVSRSARVWVSTLMYYHGLSVCVCVCVCVCRHACVCVCTRARVSRFTSFQQFEKNNQNAKLVIPLCVPVFVKRGHQGFLLQDHTPFCGII